MPYPPCFLTEYRIHHVLQTKTRTPSKKKKLLME